MSGNENGAAEQLGADSDTGLTASERAALEKEHGKEFVDRELARRTADPGNKPAPADQGDKSAGKGSETADQAKAELARLRTDENHLKAIGGRHGERAQQAALDRAEALAKAAAGDKQADEQKFVDDEMAAQSPGDFKFAHPSGRELGEGERAELQAVSQELHELGASPEIARAIWDQQSVEFFEAVRNDTIEASTKSAIEAFKAKGGDMAPINRLAAHIEKSGGEGLMMAALMAAQSTMGLRELSRIGARLARS
jgi:hypothetical protein